MNVFCNFNYLNVHPECASTMAKNSHSSTRPHFCIFFLQFEVSPLNNKCTAWVQWLIMAKTWTNLGKNLHGALDMDGTVILLASQDTEMDELMA